MPIVDVKSTNTILYCRRWRETVQFYRDVLGLRVRHTSEWFIEMQVTDSGFISIADASRATIPSGRGHGITLAWQVDDIEQTHRRLAGAGLRVGPIQKKWGARVFYFHDPEGHRLEIWANV